MNLKPCELKSLKIIVVFLCLLFVACSEDRRGEYEQYNGVQKWVESIMRKDYYWYKEMPDAEGLNFFTEPNAFFQSLLSQDDGKQKNGTRYYYSVLENLSETDTRSIQQMDYSYGFEFRVYKMGGGNQYGALILYVVPDSPAGKTGLKRGEWIFEVDGKPLSEANYTALFGGEATKFGIAIWYGNGFVPIGEYAIEAARKINDNPVHYYTIYRPANDNSKRIGYLVYNQFTAGINDEDNTYDDDLREISHEFKDKDVNEFILDLRYNNGGLLTSAELLCVILAPESALGKSIGYIEFNDRHNPQTQNISLDTNILKGGVNLNLNTLYVLVSEASASASEMVINSLSPYMKVVLIGTQTEGKNVGSATYKNEAFNWELRPIVCKVYNSEDKSDYANGFIPDYTADESLDANISSFLDFGNPNELLLNTALQLINGTYKEEENYAASRSLIGKPIPVHCSLDRRATNGVVIR